MKERRLFTRVVYQTQAFLIQKDCCIKAIISDLSLHGLLVRSEEAETLSLSSPVDVEFSLADSDIKIELVSEIIAIKGNEIRLCIDHIDIESIGHLRRLIELNCGNDDLLHRDIEHLSDLGHY